MEHGASGGSKRKGLSRRRFLQWAGAATAGALLGGCNAGRPALPAPGPVQLVYQDWRTDWFPPMAQQMLAQFHADHPGISVFYVPDPDDFEEKVLADMQAGTAPDVFQACCAFFPILGQKEYALDLRPYVRADLESDTLDDWDPAQYRALARRDGYQFGLPKYHGALALYYNKDIFDVYGVPYPDATWDHDDYLAAMKALTHDRDGDGQTDLWGSMLDVSWDRLQVHVNAWGGHFVDPNDPTRSLMCETEAIEALEWIRARMWDDRVMASFLDVRNRSTRQAFMDRMVAMVEDGSWALKDILAGASFRVGVAPMPAGPAGRVTIASTDGFGIYSGTRHPAAAWKLLKFLTSREYGLAMARANFLQPARLSLVGQWIEFVHAEFPAQAQEMDLAVFAEGHAQGYSVASEVFANMAESQRIAYAAWDLIFNLGRVPLRNLAEACRQIQQAQVGGPR